MNLLLIEDHLELQTTLARALRKRGYTVHLCSDGDQAWQMWQSVRPDLVLLDLSLPGVDGLDILQTARRAGVQTPVMILTARGTVGDRILGLNTGADDYMPKPFDLDELEARLRALLRRGQQGAGSEVKLTGTMDTYALTQPAQAMSTLGELHFDSHNQAVYWEGSILELPPRELSMLAALMQHPGKAVSKERLFGLVFPREKDVQFEAIDVVAYRLRKKLATTQVELVTLRGLGYLLRALC